MNLIFNASAGTGKTWQVTELYVALVLGKPSIHLPPGSPPVPPEKILLATFTDNAAAELRSRVTERLLAAEQDPDAEQADLARRVLRRLPAANISTLHAVCSGLLREHALELGLSPRFQTLEEDARDALLDESLRRTIFQTLETDPAFRDFCAGISVLGTHDYSLINTLRALLEKATARGFDLSRAETRLPPPEQTIGKRHFERIRDELKQYDLPATAATALDALTRALAEFPRPELIAALPKFGQAKKVKHLSDELAELKERFLTEFFYAHHFDAFRSFARCLSAAALDFSAAKRARDGVDFGDQLLLARELLRTPRRGASPFEWIIVDEAQDTSRVQCDILEALWGPATRLVLCGDKKQSIYAWRSADPAVLTDFEKKMAARGGLERVDLRQSFRSKDRVLAAVNQLFRGIYGPDYEMAALEPVEVLGALTAPQGEGPCVEFLAPDSEESTTDDEMATVARRIRLLVDGGAQWRPTFGYDGQRFSVGEPFRYGDILILLRRSTHQAALEKALRAAGVPFTVGGKGRTLFEQQEVRDLLMFLQVLCEPFNDIALIGFLRSPFAGLPDDEIIRLSWDGQTFSRETLRQQFFEGGSIAAERLLRYRQQTGEKLPSQLVREVVRETAFDAFLAGQPGGAQKLANFKKALDWLRTVERGGQTLLPDVVRRFETCLRDPPRSGAAEALLPDPERNVVTLMTVHSAKGLTRRVCFIPDIRFGELNEPGFALLSADGRLELKMSGPDGDEVKSPGWDVARTADKAVREAELTNLFYVAMTRARDLTVLSGIGVDEPKGWMKQAENFFQTAAPEILRCRVFAEVPELRRSAPEEEPLEPVFGCAPLRLPAGLERRPVTSLCEAADSAGPLRRSGPRDSARCGTIGHAVLETLANDGWTGDLLALVAQSCDEFGPVETGPLIEKLAAARAVLQAATAGAQALFTEFPFVLRRGNLILDGTVDLLVRRSADEWEIYDYKFTDEPPMAVQARYAPQLAAYHEAVQALHPGAKVGSRLVVIGPVVQLLSVP
jgi:ATP-dependent helicase/nuclease subunit A